MMPRSPLFFFFFFFVFFFVNVFTKNHNIQILYDFLGAVYRDKIYYTAFQLSVQLKIPT